MPDKTLLDHLEVIAEFIDDMEQIGLTEDLTIDVGPVCKSYKALTTFFQSYYEAQVVNSRVKQDLEQWA